MTRIPLHRIALARSGDKGDVATLSLIVLDPRHFAAIERQVTAEAVRAHYRGVVRGAVERHVLPQLFALHFVMHAALGGGVTRSLALDAHGKTLASALLDLEVDLDDDAAAPAA